MEIILEKIFESKFLLSLTIIVLGYVVQKVLRTIIDKSTNNRKIPGKKLTYIKLFRNMLKYLVVLVTGLVVIQINGFDITSLVAGLGIVGIIVGFAVQDFIKDIVAGLNIITDDVFSVGDVIKYKDVEGKVISVGLKHTKIQDIYTDNMFIIANGNIQEVINVSNITDLAIPISYDEDVEKVETLFEALVNEIKTFEYVTDCKLLGITEFKESSVPYKIRIFCKPTKKLQVRRQAFRLIKMTLDKSKIKIPYNKLDVYMQK